MINPEWTWWQTRFHYNLVENAIIDGVYRYYLDKKVSNASELNQTTVLDIGSGTGHFIDFFLNTMEVDQITGVDFAETSVEGLQEKYQQEPSVEIRNEDISQPESDFFSKKYDIVNAIGILFHIVDDQKWLEALKNINELTSEGLVFVGGEFKDRTERISHWRKVRSTDRWREALEELDCRILEIKRFDWFSGAEADGITDNVLIFETSTS